RRRGARRTFQRRRTCESGRVLFNGADGQRHGSALHRTVARSRRVLGVVMGMADRFAAASMPQYGGLLQATLIDTEAALRTLRAEWNELLQASASDKLFLTWEWLYTWWQHLAGDRTLYVIAL